ncbi:MAG: OmpA family protein [Bacteroidia bacterium]|nr:OmpA family protein [Bacteroidia bacterium]
MIKGIFCWSQLCRLSFLSLIGILLACTAFAQPSKKDKSALGQAKEHLKFEEYERAIPLISQLLEDQPRNAYYNFWMGKSLYLAYQRTKALRYFDITNEVDPTIDREFHYYYALTLHYNLKFDQAVEEYQLDLERYKDNSPEYQWVTNRIEQCMYAKKLTAKRIHGRVEIRNMGDRINTPYSEHSPVISGNDSILLFTARRPDGTGAKPLQGYYDEDIYISYNQNGQWSEAKNIDKPVNSKGHDATISLNASGNKLFLYRNNKQGGLYRTDFDSKGQKWNSPKAVQKPLNSKYYEASICESADSSIMFFTSDRPGGYGGRDIYIVARDEKGKWGDPRNLGPEINTPFDEDAPYFHPDGKTLYYSSNGPNSMGGFDIFITEFDSIMGGWLTPLNLGAQVNTPDDDIYFTVSSSGKYGYFSSGKEGGYGEKDIYELEFPYFPFPRRYTIIELLGLVRDKETGQELDAEVRVLDNQTRETLTTLNTADIKPPFVIELNPLTEYQLNISSPGYQPLSEIITTPELKRDADIELERNFDLIKETETTAVTVGKRFKDLPTLEHIYFDFDKSELREESKSELDMVAELLVQNPDLRLQLAGHADYYNTFDYNQVLSENRAKAAFAYLTQKGISKSQLSVAGLSENKPLGTNHNDEGRQFNRRVEFDFFLNGEMVFQSEKLRPGSEGPVVDHTPPKGLAGYDHPEFAVAASSAGSDPDDWVPEQDALANTIKSGTNMDPSTTKTQTAGKDPATTKIGGNQADDSGGTQTASNLPGPNDMVRNIYFDFDASGLRDQSIAELQKIAGYLQSNPDLKLEIMGHTDSYGSVEYNQLLSENRSKAALDFLTATGIDASRITLSAYSELKPLDSNNSANGRQLNRRVEFKLTRAGQTWLKSIP